MLMTTNFLVKFKVQSYDSLKQYNFLNTWQFFTASDVKGIDSLVSQGNNTADKIARPITKTQAPWRMPQNCINIWL
jgi:hypothetical protein